MSANASTTAPTGRKTLAQGKERSDAALGNPPPNTSSPEGAKELPEGWLHLSFEEALEPISDEGKRVDQSEYLAEGQLPVIDQGEAFIGGYTNALERKYDGPLPVVVFGDHTRRVKLVDFPFVVGAQGVKLLRPRKCWQPRFFAHLLPTLPIPDRGYGRHYQFVRQLSFPCPPLPEQRRIVAEIEKQFTRMEAGVAALRRVQANLKRYRAAVLKAACEGKLVPTEAELTAENAKSAKKNARSVSAPSANSAVKIAGYETGEQLLQRILAERRKNWTGRGKYKEPAAPDTANLPALPEGWRWASVEQITENFDGRRVPLKSADRDKRSGQYPYYGASGIIDDIDDFLFDGDFLLIAEDGANLLSRSTPIAFKATGKFWVNNHAHIVQTHGDIPLSFLATFLNGKDLSFSVTGSAQPKLTQAALNKIAVPLPPLAEQTRIVAEVERRLSVVEELESVVSANLQRATRLRQSILQKAFTGGLV